MHSFFENILVLLPKVSPAMFGVIGYEVFRFYKRGTVMGVVREVGYVKYLFIFIFNLILASTVCYFTFEGANLTLKRELFLAAWLGLSIPLTTSALLEDKEEPEENLDARTLEIQSDDTAIDQKKKLGVMQVLKLYYSLK